MFPYAAPLAVPISQQLFWLLVLAIPIATVTRTVVFEEVFREPREYCQHRRDTARSALKRKFFYLFTCEYCFSHYVTVFFLVLTRYKLLMDGWRGYLIAFFALVLVTNIYLNIYARLRLELTQTKAETKKLEKEAEVAALTVDDGGADGEDR